VVFIISKRALPPEPAPPPTKSCPYCGEKVPADATRCRACTSDLTAA
jgi:large conductance mechanosensitive channel